MTFSDLSFPTSKNKENIVLIKLYYFGCDTFNSPKACCCRRPNELASGDTANGVPSAHWKSFAFHFTFPNVSRCWESLFNSQFVHIKISFTNITTSAQVQTRQMSSLQSVQSAKNVHSWFATSIFLWLRQDMYPEDGSSLSMDLQLCWIQDCQDFVFCLIVRPRLARLRVLSLSCHSTPNIGVSASSSRACLREPLNTSGFVVSKRLQMRAG